MPTDRLAAITAISLISALVAFAAAPSCFPRDFAAHRRRQAKPRRHLAGVQHRGSRSPGSRRALQHAGRAVGCRRRRNPVSALGRREEGRELSKSAEGRSARPVLHARRASDHVSGFPVSDLPDTPGRRHDLRVVAGLSPDLHRRQSAPRRHRYPGWAIRAAIGTETRWLWTSATTTTKPGSTWRATFTATRSTSSSDTA